nr:immunoglobulin light chain junction region [Macaca mulatta]
ADYYCSTDSSGNYVF